MSKIGSWHNQRYQITILFYYRMDMLLMSDMRVRLNTQNTTPPQLTRLPQLQPMLQLQLSRLLLQLSQLSRLLQSTTLLLQSITPLQFTMLPQLQLSTSPRLLSLSLPLLRKPQRLPLRRLLSWDLRRKPSQLRRSQKPLPQLKRLSKRLPRRLPQKPVPKF